VEWLGPDGLLSQVTKAVLERALAEEMTGHLGYDKHDPAGRGSGNNRNGTTPKTVLTDIGAVDLAVPATATGASSRPKDRKRPLTCVELRDFEPLTPSMRTTGARVVQDRSGKSVDRIDPPCWGSSPVILDRCGGVVPGCGEHGQERADPESFLGGMAE
jgi:Transposase, Mutator family